MENEQGFNRKRINDLFDLCQPQLEPLGVFDASKKLEGERSVHELRKTGDRRDRDNVSILTLKETDGVLRWESGAGFSRSAISQRRSGAQRYAAGQIVRQIKFTNLEPNQVDEKLKQLDSTLNDHQGLFELKQNPNSGNWVRANQLDRPVPTGKILLLIHGTFSSSDNNLTGFNETSFGRKFLAEAGRKYKQLLVFSHPTVGVSPFANAVGLSSYFQKSDVDVDMICHSRGGLVARWWGEKIDSFSKRKIKTVYLGSTLGGTRLASPYHLKSSLNLLTNIGTAVATGAAMGSALIPAAGGFFAASMGLHRIFTNVVGAFRKTPIIDAGVALVPGLNGQSRQGANSEIVALREHFASLPRSTQNQIIRSSLFMTSDFQPEPKPWWHFWKYFNKQRIANFAADRIFPGANDLVVDTESMNELCDEVNLTQQQKQLIHSKLHTHAFGTNSRIHHLNYLSHPTTLKKISAHLL